MITGYVKTFNNADYPATVLCSRLLVPVHHHCGVSHHQRHLHGLKST